MFISTDTIIRALAKLIAEDSIMIILWVVYYSVTFRPKLKSFCCG